MKINLKRQQPKPTQPATLTIAIEQCDKRGCERLATHHITYDMSSLGTVHQALCELHFEQWQVRQRAKERPQSPS